MAVRPDSVEPLSFVCGCSPSFPCTAMTPAAKKDSDGADLAELGRLFREYRKAAGMTQQQVADRAGLHWTYVSGVERGIHNPTFRVLLYLARAVGVAPRDLFPKR